MSPEELEATREGANVDYAPDIAYEDWQAMARALLAHIDSQAAQISALKEKLVEERARRICHHPREDEVGHWPRYEDVVVKEARKQLAQEMPEVEWE